LESKSKKMFAIFRKKLFIFGLVLMGGLYAVKWERDKAAAVHIQQISNLLDDRMHPGNNDFAGRRARLCQILATLKEAGDEGLDELMICRKAAEEIDMDESYIDVLAESLAQNTRTAMNLGILDAEGRVVTVNRGYGANAGAFLLAEVHKALGLPPPAAGAAPTQGHTTTAD
jgi:hypothetical protein